jgi:hypothetical protein
MRGARHTIDGGQEDIEMLLLISGAIIGGAVGLAALYDSIARRRPAGQLLPGPVVRDIPVDR